MRFRPQDYFMRRSSGVDTGSETGVEVEGRMPQNVAQAFGLWLLTPIVAFFPTRWLKKWFGRHIVVVVE